MLLFHSTPLNPRSERRVLLIRGDSPFLTTNSFFLKKILFWGTMAFLIILFEGKTSKAVSRTFFCKRPCTRTTYDVQQMPVIESDDFMIGLNFELSVDLTWNRFSSSIWDVITGFGGSVSIVLYSISLSSRYPQWGSPTPHVVFQISVFL